MAHPPLTKEAAGHIARLARLRLDDSELERMTAELSKILAYVEVLDGVDTSQVEPTLQINNVPLPLRPDVAMAGVEREEALAQAPRRIGDGFGVPGFVEE